MELNDYQTANHNFTSEDTRRFTLVDGNSWPIQYHHSSYSSVIQTFLLAVYSFQQINNYDELVMIRIASILFLPCLVLLQALQPRMYPEIFRGLFSTRSLQLIPSFTKSIFTAVSYHNINSNQRVIHSLASTKVYMNLPSASSSSAANLTRYQLFGNLTSEQEAQIREIGGSLLDFDLIFKVLEQWSRPIPPRYTSMPLVLAGPSGVGKGRLIKALQKDYGKFFERVVTHTTRSPRRDEVNGTNYHFISRERFTALVAEGGFLEHSTVHDNLYGISLESWTKVRSMNMIPILEIDIQGARHIKKISRGMDLDPTFVFVAPPCIEMLHERLLLRGSETAEQIALRLQNAKEEISQSEEPNLFQRKIVNDDIQLATNAIFRFARDMYPALPSAARIRMIQRKIKKIKAVLRDPNYKSSL